LLGFFGKEYRILVNEKERGENDKKDNRKKHKQLSPFWEKGWLLLKTTLRQKKETSEGPTKSFQTTITPSEL